MTLGDLIETIIASSMHDWHLIGLSDDEVARYCGNHPYVAAFKSDPSITLAFGSTEKKDLHAPWCKKINSPPDGRTSTHFADVYYNGALVFRTWYASVNDGAAWLPMPTSAKNLSIPVRYKRFVQLLHDLIKEPAEFDETFFFKASFKLDKTTEWPQL